MAENRRKGLAFLDGNLPILCHKCRFVDIIKIQVIVFIGLIRVGIQTV